MQYKNPVDTSVSKKNFHLSHLVLTLCAKVSQPHPTHPILTSHHIVTHITFVTILYLLTLTLELHQISLSFYSTHYTLGCWRKGLPPLLRYQYYFVVSYHYKVYISSISRNLTSLPVLTVCKISLTSLTLSNHHIHCLYLTVMVALQQWTSLGHCLSTQTAIAYHQ